METVSYMTLFFFSLAFCQDEQSKQPTERKKTEDTFTLQADVRELRAFVTKREISVQQKENEELKKLIEDCKQMNTQVQHLIKKNESKNP